MPVGAIVFAEHWIFPRLDIERHRAARYGWIMNWRALAVWAGTLAVCFLLPVHLFFRWLPGYVLAIAAYTLLNLPARKEQARA